jgi:hypothetical protein
MHGPLVMQVLVLSKAKVQESLPISCLGAVLHVPVESPPAACPAAQPVHLSAAGSQIFSTLVPSETRLHAPPGLLPSAEHSAALAAASC